MKIMFRAIRSLYRGMTATVLRNDRYAGIQQHGVCPHLKNMDTTVLHQILYNSPNTTAQSATGTHFFTHTKYTKTYYTFFVIYVCHAFNKKPPTGDSAPV